MKTLAFFITFFVSVPCFAQIKKAEKFFTKGNYEKSLEALSKEKITRENKKAVTSLKLKCNYHLYLQSKKPALLDKSFAIFIQLYKIDKDAIDEYINTGLHNEIKILARNYNAKPDLKRARIYSSHLATYFKDTTEFYYTYYPKKIISEADNSVNEVNVNGEIKKKASRESIVDFSKNYTGIKYKWGGEDISGFDCSGFVLFVMRNFGYDFNHGAKDQSELGVMVEKDKVRPGDLLFFGKSYPTGKCKIDHVAIVYSLSNGQTQVIHCTSKGVVIQELIEGDYWTKKILFYKNIID